MTRAEPIKQVTSQIQGWSIVACAALLYSLQYLTRVSTNMLTEELMLGLSIDATRLSVLSSMYFFAYLLMLIPIGLCLDTKGPRLTFFVCGIVFSLGTFIFALSQSFYSAAIGRLMMGVGGACGFIGTIKIGSIVLPKEKVGLVAAVTIAFGTVGAIAGGYPILYLKEFCDWRTLMLMFALLSFLLTLSIRIVVPSRPNQKFVPKIVYLKIRKMILNRKMWIFATYGALTIVPIVVLGDLCGKDFLEKHSLITTSYIPPILASMFFGISIGSPIVTMLGTKFHAKTLPLLMSTFMLFFSFVLLLLSPSLSNSSAMILFFLIGFSYGGKSIGFAAFLEELPQAMMGISVSIANAIITCGPALTLPIVGTLLDYSYSGIEKDHITMSSYSFYDFQIALGIIPIILFASMVILVFQDEVSILRKDHST